LERLTEDPSEPPFSRLGLLMEKAREADRRVESGDLEALEDAINAWS
jgi:hypothetical protein